MSNVYVFTYLGSKLRMIDEIQYLSPTDASELYEVCGGFGSFILNNNCLYDRAVYNELNPLIYNLMHVLKHKSTEYIERLTMLEGDKGTFDTIKEYYADGFIELEDSVDKALAFTLLQINSYNGNRIAYVDKVRSLAWKRNVQKRLREVSSELKNIELENRDCLEIINEQRDNVNAFIIFDIPYELGERVTKGIYGEFDWDDSLHDKAYNTVRDIDGETGCKIMLMTYESKLYDKLLGFGWQKIHLKDIHSPAGLKGKPRKRKNEYVYLNYDTYSELAKYHFDLG